MEQMDNMYKVLIVEDEEIIRRGLVYTIDWLAMGCMVVGAAANGREGLAMMEEWEPDIVIADILMPEMTGIEMLEAAKELALKPFKSIILTSYADFEYARKAIHLEAAEYLLKPLDEDQLREVISRVKKTMEEIKAYSSMRALTQQTGGMSLVDWEEYFNGTVPINPYVIKALRKIMGHYAEKLSMEALADELNVSPSYLSRKFKEVTSQTFLDFLTRYRIQKAIGLLQKGEYRVYEVSDMTGFSDYKHFCTVFKKYTKTSPTEFVKSLGGVVHK